MSCNINKLIDIIENEPLSRKILGCDYKIDSDGNLRGDYLRLRGLKKRVGVNEALYFFQCVHYDEVEKFLSYATFNGFSDFRLPNLKELSSLIDLIDMKLYDEPIFWSSEISSITEFPMALQFINNGKKLKIESSYKGDMWKFPFIIVR